MHSDAVANMRQQVALDDFKKLRLKIPFTWTKDALIDWEVIALTLTAFGITMNPLLILPAVLIIGNRQHALALLGHDGTHYTICNNRRLNDRLNDLLAWFPLGLTGDGYRNLHNIHHSALGTENDPELVYKGLRGQWDLPAKLPDVLRLAARDLIGGGVEDYRIIFLYSKPTKLAPALQLAAYHLATNAALIVLGLWWVSALWYVSLLTSFIMFFRLRMWIEHQGTETTQRLHLNWWQGPLLAPHSSWHHFEHHFWPSLPYSALADMRRLTPGVPVQTLSELIARYESFAPVASGTPFAKIREALGDDPTVVPFDTQKVTQGQTLQPTDGQNAA
jgi:fatty acid desaturase